MRKTFSVLLLSLFLASCSTTPAKLNPNYNAYLSAISNYHPKLVEIKAQPGQTIEMKGVAEFIVYAPSNNNRRIAPYIAPTNPAVQITHEFLSTVFGTAKDILPGYFGWRYGSSILKKAFDSAGNHYNGDYTNVGGDYTLGDKTMGNKYTAQGDIVGQDKNTVAGDYVTGTKTTNDVTGDYVTGTKTDTTVQGDYVTGTETKNTDSYNKTNGNVDNSTVSE